jgi:hypothetical protein
MKKHGEFLEEIVIESSPENLCLAAVFLTLSLFFFHITSDAYYSLSLNPLE